MKLRSSDNMRELKYNTYEKPAREGDEEKTNKPLQPSDHENWNHHVHNDKQDLGCPKNKVFFKGQDLSFVNVGYFTAAILLKVLVKNPCQVGDAIKDKPIDMLKPVVRVNWLAFVQAHKGFYIYIGIHSLNVGISVMINIMLYFPIVRVASKDIQKIS